MSNYKYVKGQILIAVLKRSNDISNNDLGKRWKKKKKKRNLIL